MFKMDFEPGTQDPPTMSRGRITPQTHRLHTKAKLREAARRRAEALAARKAARAQAGPSASPDPACDRAVIDRPVTTSTVTPIAP
jgi:hypothetical protein